MEFIEAVRTYLQKLSDMKNLLKAMKLPKTGITDVDYHVASYNDDINEVIDWIEYAEEHLLTLRKIEVLFHSDLNKLEQQKEKNVEKKG